MTDRSRKSLLPRGWVPVMFLAVVVCGYLIWSHSEGVSGDSTGTPRPTAGGDYCFPNLPDKISTRIKEPQKSLFLAKRLRDVVGWSEDSLVIPRFTSVYAGKGFQGFVIMHDVGFGQFVWEYLLYVSRGSGPAQNWHLLCTGPVASTGEQSDDFRVYVYSERGNLVFARPNGEVIRTVPIKQPLEQMEKHLAEEKEK